MSAAEATSQQACYGHSATTGQETGCQIQRRGLHVLRAVLDMEDPLH